MGMSSYIWSDTVGTNMTRYKEELRKHGFKLEQDYPWLTMRTFSVTLHNKNRNRSVTYTAEEFKFRNGRLWIYHRELGNVVTKIEPDEELTITEDREEEEYCQKIPTSAYA